MSYIEKEAAIKFLRKECFVKYPNTFASGLGVAAEEISKMPTADVVEVVRCRDCKKWEQYENTAGAGYCHNKNYCFTYGATLDREFTPITMHEDFCSYGERREENEG